MIGRLILLAALVVGLLLFLNWFRRTPPEKVAKLLRRSALYGGIGLLVLLAATGRLNPLFAALAAAVPVVLRAVNLLRMLPAIQQVLRALGLSSVPGAGVGGGRAGAAGQRSSIRTRLLEMTLDHSTGEMDGLVLEGPFEGQRLSELNLSQLAQLLSGSRATDAQSAALLEAYLDRVHGDAWREHGEYTGASVPEDHAAMTRDEALAILGLKPGAGQDQVREAHRRLMQKFHPDRGGSDYLASKINEAKRFLLGD
ncbi:MAG: molecular chaperone DnaJ [Pseudomonadota bacterium]|nr:molecular chaperone DnaJ [Pseudomonadota bacterium]